MFKTENEYQRAIGRELYEATPKAVFAALFVSYLANIKGVQLDPLELESEILDEWKKLHAAGIVPQKPPKP